MHLSHIPQCTIQNWIVHISVLNDALWDMGLVHCGICEIGLLWLLTSSRGGSEYLFYMISSHLLTVIFSIFYIFVKFHFCHFISHFIHRVIYVFFIFDFLLTLNWFIIAIFSTILFHLSSIFDMPFIQIQLSYLIDYSIHCIYFLLGISRCVSLWCVQ